MYEDAIKTISNLLDHFSNTVGLEIIEESRIKLNFTNPQNEQLETIVFETDEKGNSATIQWLEWMEKNLPEK